MRGEEAPAAAAARAGRGFDQNLFRFFFTSSNARPRAASASPTTAAAAAAAGVLCCETCETVDRHLARLSWRCRTVVSREAWSAWWPSTVPGSGRDRGRTTRSSEGRTILRG